MSAHLQVASLSAGYGPVPVLQDVSLQVERGEIVAVIGANGAGKTTLLLALSGHVRPSAGHIVFAGADLDKQPAHRTVARGLVMVPEGGRLFPFMTVLENLELGAYHRRARARLRGSLDEVLTLFPILAERRSQLAGRLSGGERTMAAIARAMMSLPELLLLDEPSLGLSPLMVARVFEMIRTLVRLRGLSVLLVEQNVAEALQMCGRAYVLERGRVTKTGTGAALARDEDVQRAYMGL